MNKKNIMIILAAGEGLRAKSSQQDNIPKQYKLLRGKVLLQYALETALKCQSIEKVQIVINNQHQQFYEKTCQNVENSQKLLPVVEGGNSRQMSAYCGLKAIEKHQPDNVLIHDAARPFISEVLIQSLIEKLKNEQAVIPYIKINDALKKINKDNEIIQHLNRDEYVLAQTPQAFRFNEIMQAHENAKANNKNNFQDDSELAHWHKIKICAIKGDENNIKITNEKDFKI